MSEPKTKEEWNKVRKLYQSWAHTVKYWIPTKAYMVVSFVGGIYSLYLLLNGRIKLIGSKIDLLIIFVTVVAILQFLVRSDSETEAYVDGFDQGIDFYKGEDTLDDLIGAVEKRKK